MTTLGDIFRRNGHAYRALWPNVVGEPKAGDASYRLV